VFFCAEHQELSLWYPTGAGACVIAFSTTDRDSFDAVASWKRKVEAEVGSIPMCLVQNKVDLIDQASMSPDEAENTARTLGLKFYRTCVHARMRPLPHTGLRAWRESTPHTGLRAWRESTPADGGAEAHSPWRAPQTAVRCQSNLGADG
jgi:hypothetical protein